jgi:hypothetical protein
MNVVVNGWAGQRRVTISSIHSPGVLEPGVGAEDDDTGRDGTITNLAQDY